MIRRCWKKVRESIDQQIKDAMAKKVVGQTTRLTRPGCWSSTTAHSEQPGE
jgi:hypothetical protein